MGIERKSIGALIDELSVVNLKCWFAQEEVMHAEGDEAVAKAAKTAQITNARRNQLMRAIDEYFSDDSGVLAKSYDAES